VAGPRRHGSSPPRVAPRARRPTRRPEPRRARAARAAAYATCTTYDEEPCTCTDGEACHVFFANIDGIDPDSTVEAEIDLPSASTVQLVFAP
jgi:hypothetical protein